MDWENIWEAEYLHVGSTQNGSQQRSLLILSLWLLSSFQTVRKQVNVIVCGCRQCSRRNRLSWLILPIFDQQEWSQCTQGKVSWGVKGIFRLHRWSQGVTWIQTHCFNYRSLGWSVMLLDMNVMLGIEGDLLTNIGLEPFVAVYWRIYWRWNRSTYGLVPRAVMMIWILTN